MNGKTLTLTGLFVVLVGAVLWWALTPGNDNAIYGLWTVDDDVELEFTHDGQFTFIVAQAGLDFKSLHGRYTYLPDQQQLQFSRDDGALFTWDQVAIENGTLNYTASGRTHTLYKSGRASDQLQLASGSGTSVLAVFPFNRQLARDLNTDSNFVEIWELMSGFRHAYAGFDSALLLEQHQPGSMYPFVTLDQWDSAEAFDAFAKIFQTKTVGQADYLQDQPSVYVQADEKGMAPSTQDYVVQVSFLNTPDDLRDTFLEQWTIFSDYIEKQAGFHSATLYRNAGTQSTTFDYFIYSTWASGEAYTKAMQSEFAKALLSEGTYQGTTGAYRVVAEDIQRPPPPP